MSERRPKRHSLGDVNYTLPDDVLDNILSFLPINKVMQVGSTSTRFKGAWILCRRLDFDDNFAQARSPATVKSLINRIFDLHAGKTVLSFRLCFNRNDEEFLVEKWVKKAVEKGVEEIDLESYVTGIFPEGIMPFQLPSDAFDIESLKVLKLNFCQLDLPHRLKGLRFLKTIVLRKMRISQPLLDTLFLHCLLLETLDLAECHIITFHLIIFAPNLNKFKVLKVGECREVARIDIDTQTLQSFHYCGHVCIIKFASLPHLKDVLLNFRPSKSFTEAFWLRNLVYDLYHISALTTTSIFLEGLCSKFIGGEMREMQFYFWNLKELHFIMEGAIYCNPYDIVSFLKHCPCLEKLFIDLNDFSFVCGVYWELRNRQAFEQYRESFNCMTFVKLTGFKFQKYELMLARFILEKAKNLEKLVLVTPRSKRAKFSASDPEFYYQYLQSAKASPMAKIAVYEHWNDASAVCPRHSRIWY